jgi:hypothetical protein
LPTFIALDPELHAVICIAICPWAHSPPPACSESRCSTNNSSSHLHRLRVCSSPRHRWLVSSFHAGPVQLEQPRRRANREEQPARAFPHEQRRSPGTALRLRTDGRRRRAEEEPLTQPGREGPPPGTPRGDLPRGLCESLPIPTNPDEIQPGRDPADMLM